MSSSKPEIFDFLDPVDFLNSHFAWRKTIDTKFSIGQWQEELGIGSRTLLRFILLRRRRISPRTVAVLISNIGLSQAESQYFEILLAHSYARNFSERKSLGDSLLRLQRKTYRPKIVATSQIHGSALKPVILAMMTYQDIAFTPELIADLLNIDSAIVVQALEPLVSDGLIKFDPSGVYKFDSKEFSIGDSLGDPNLKAYYSHWLEQAKIALDSPPETRRYRAIKFALSPDEFHKVQERMAEFAIQLLSSYQASTAIGRRLYMLESALFPLTREIRRSDRREPAQDKN